MIWTIIVLTAICLYLGILLRRRDATISDLRRDFASAKSLADQTVTLNETLVADYKAYADGSEHNEAEAYAIIWTLIDERDDALKMLELVLAKVPESIEGHRQTACEIGVDGVSYQFDKEHQLATAT